ncbi:SGNH/GDSL hydrolase family protein [Streptomyces vinaceus]|uniref:hypothetical protein n=1 Tax=Streptomyces vinaceus TaxID=1960 RepID=UPI0037F507CD
MAGSMGINTLGFDDILKQCSAKLRGREGDLLPGAPVNADSPAGDCAAYFESFDGATWVDAKLQKVADELSEMLRQVRYRAPHAKRVLVGYPRLVPQDTAKCLAPAPGQSELPFADIPADALPFLARTEKLLDEVLNTAAFLDNVTFVDLYGQTGTHTACDGAQRGIGGLLENSELGIGQSIPWFAHPNRKGRDLQAQHVAAKIEQALNR